MQMIFNLPKNLDEDLSKFKEEIERFKNGSISGTEFRSFRVPQGVYEQRKEGTYMLRVRFPAGSVLPHQMRVLASVSKKYGDGVLHVTTRQDIQIHSVLLDGIYTALLELYDAGLSTKGGGGNTVRNIIACYNAGVCAKEVFDVTPFAVALTEFLLANPTSYQLPRKYKIAFSGCSKDCTGAVVNDLGFIAKKKGDELGFTVYVGGGMGTHSRIADQLEEFVSPDKIYLIAEAIKLVFDKYGNRKNKHRARLRFLIEQMGFNQFQKLYKDELLGLSSKELPVIQLREIPRQERTITKADLISNEEFAEWSEKNTEPQRQHGYYLAYIPLILGDISADSLENLADIAEMYGEGMIRSTQSQNLVIRWVHENELHTLYKKLTNLNLAKNHANIIRNTVVCTGASTCRLGICLSRGLANAVINKISNAGIDLDKFDKLDIHISGCPNSCSRHPIGHIGMFGAARRIGERLVPHYIIQLGGKLAEGETKFAQGKYSVPAKNVPAFMTDFLKAFQESSLHPDYEAFLEISGRNLAEQLADKYKHVPSFEVDKDYYFDWGSESLFSLADRGPGECSSGVFDLIDVDLANAHESVQKGKLLPAIILASKALLITQGQEAKNDAEALILFSKYFIDTGLVDESFRELVENSQLSMSKKIEDFNIDIDEVSAFVSVVKSLYDNMDQSLRFQPVLRKKATEAESITI
jgi:sulfite reductase (ferredoxin)